MMKPADRIVSPAPFEHVDTIRPLLSEFDHDLALSVIDRMAEDGAMHDAAHPRYEAFDLLFDVIYDYEHVHCLF
ncbi:hypothetical protein VI08_01330 [Luteibacter yeojuensis]|uniref:Uncharacterized protein n=2 Tax=Luteibacter yeojuensis TaxID=345309 RepID=A0A0F3L1D2_9GAMM|nr:hypothetical protein VI08_01330 [Luteibacter yeojuensis]